MDESKTSGGKKIFENISHLTWEHPADRAALNTLRNVPVLDQIIKTLMKFFPEKILKLQYLSSAIRLNENQIPRVYNILKEVCEILDADRIPEIYIVQDPTVNAMAIGADKPFLVFNSALIKNMNDEEIMYVMGHEMGHVLSGHVLYKQIFYLIKLLLSGSTVFLPPEVGGVIKFLLDNTLWALLLDWNRKSELSADRAGLLCTQNPEIVYKGLMNMAGGSFEEDMSVDEFIKQADDYEGNVDVLESFYKLLISFDKSHPFVAVRLKEIKKWVDKGEYDKVLNGDYKKTGNKKEDYKDVFNDWKNSFENYKQDLHESNDPLDKIFSSVNDGLLDLGKRAEDFLGGFMKNTKPKDEDKTQDE